MSFFLFDLFFFFVVVGFSFYLSIPCHCCCFACCFTFLFVVWKRVSVYMCLRVFDLQQINKKCCQSESVANLVIFFLLLLNKKSEFLLKNFKIKMIFKSNANEFTKKQKKCVYIQLSSRFRFFFNDFKLMPYKQKSLCYF